MSSKSGLIAVFGSLPIRKLAGPTAVLFVWPPRPSRRQKGR
jgi:hypothetical protein